MRPTSKQLIRVVAPLSVAAVLLFPLAGSANTNGYLLKVGNEKGAERPPMPRPAANHQRPVVEARVVLPTWQWSDTELARAVEFEASLGAVAASELGERVNLEQSKSQEAFADRMDQGLSNGSEEGGRLSDPSLTKLDLFSSDLSALDEQSHLFSAQDDLASASPVKEEKPQEALADISTAAGGDFIPKPENLPHRAMIKQPLAEAQVDTRRLAERAYWVPINPVPATAAGTALGTAPGNEFGTPPKSAQQTASVSPSLDNELTYQRDVNREARRSYQQNLAVEQAPGRTERELQSLPQFMKRVTGDRDAEFFDSLDQRQLQSGFAVRQGQHPSSTFRAEFNGGMSVTMPRR